MDETNHVNFRKPDVQNYMGWQPEPCNNVGFNRIGTNSMEGSGPSFGVNSDSRLTFFFQNIFGNKSSAVFGNSSESNLFGNKSSAGFGINSETNLFGNNNEALKQLEERRGET